jgi:hypothetical protein
MAACYNLNGRQSPFDDKTHVPCNMTAVEAGGHSTCCPIGDYCLTNGMCKNAKDSEGSNWYWRTACTDKTWNDPACPKYCEPIEPTRNTGLVFNCLKKESWCCAYVGEKGLKGWSSRASINTTCCAIDDLTFQAEDPIVYATATAPIKLSIQSTSTAPATTDRSSTLFSSIALTATSATEMDISGLPTSDSGESAGNATQDQSSSSSSSSEGLGTGAKIGLGVGIPLAVIGLAAIGAFFWLQRRRKTLSTKEDGPHLLDSSAASKQTAPPYQETSANQQGSVVYRHEAPSKTPAVELPATTDMAELPPQGKR